MQTVLKQEFQRFGEGTTIRGVPRIFKSKSRLVRCMWLFAVFLCLGILAWQLHKTFANYYQWPIDTIYREAVVRPVFPDVTVCNIYPMAYASRMPLQWDEYQRYAINKRQLLPYNTMSEILNISVNEYNYVWSLVMSPVGYFSTLPVSEVHSVEHAKDLIIDYNYFAWDWTKSGARGSFRGVWSPEHSMCYTLQLDKASSTQVRGISAILYIDNFPKTKSPLTPYSPGPTQAVSTGVRVIVHPPGTQPNIKIGKNIGPGTETTLHVSNTKRIRLPLPYGNCTEQRHLDAADPSEVYSKDACYDVCLQRMIIERCGCVSAFLQFTRHQLSNVNSTICGNQSFTDGVDTTDPSSTVGFKQWLCMLRTDLDQTTCDAKCIDPCEEDLYDMVVSSAPWPHVSKQLDVFTTYVSGNENLNVRKDQFVAYGNILNEYPTLTAEEVAEKLRQVHTLEENFIQLNVIFDKMYPMTLRCIPSVTSEKLLALIGGTLSLWLGITVVNAIEFVDFFYAVLRAVRKSKKTNPSSCDNPAEHQDTHKFAESATSDTHC